jgi:hypothetical protein
MAWLSAGLAKGYEVEYWAGNRPRVLEPFKSAAAAAAVRSYTLQTLPLVLSERAVLKLGDETYAIGEEGLYRIREKHESKVVRQSILYRQDVWRFAGHLSRLYVYGARHQSEDQKRWDERALGGEPLSLQCGYVSMFVRHHLQEQKIEARLVGCVSGSNWKHYDDGHALMEICDSGEKKWIAFDPTLGARFQGKDGRWLNLLELTRLYRAGGRAARIDFLNAEDKIDSLEDYRALYSKYISSKSEMDAFLPQFKPLLMNDVEAIHRWYGRVMQIPVIDNCFVPESDAEDALLRTLPSWRNLERLTEAQFRERFYDHASCRPVSTEKKAGDKK